MKLKILNKKSSLSISDYIESITNFKFDYYFVKNSNTYALHYFFDTKLFLCDIMPLFCYRTIDNEIENN